MNTLAQIVIKNPLPTTGQNIVTTLVQLVFGALGGISLIVIVWAGLKYTLSSGDPGKTAEAKNQIMYAAIGLAVAIFAQAILAFAVGWFA